MSIKYHVINKELKSHDSFLELKYATDLVEHFLDDGYKVSDIIIINGVEFSIAPTLQEIKDDKKQT
jgi:hypothetical protein